VADERLHHLLIAERDDAVRRLLARRLEREGFAVDELADPSAVAAKVESLEPDLVLLELGGANGWADLLELRDVSDVPLICLLWADGGIDESAVLDMGADDCVVRPLSFRSLVARTRAVLRRASAPPTRVIRLGQLELDLAARTALLGTSTIPLTAREFDLLAFLASHPGEVFSRDEILTRVWRSSADWQQRETVTEHVHRLRARLETDPGRPRWLVTVRGVGYRLTRPDEDDADTAPFG